ncbi:MAG: hypothetical protein AAGC60_04875 [Acidobacteriota bacterium]
MTSLELDELNRILGDEVDLRPSPGFSTRVLSAVRAEAAARPPIDFPWSRLLPGLVLSLSLLVAAALWTIPAADLWVPRTHGLAEWSSDPSARTLLWAVGTLLGSLALASAALRSAIPRSVSSF